MKEGKVHSAVWATRKTDGLTGQTLLRVTTDSGSVVAVDRVGAGPGDRVLVAFGYAAGRDTGIPTDAAVVAILDTQGGSV